MDKHTTNGSTISGLPYVLMCVLLALAVHTVWAQAATDGCEMNTLKAAFKDGVKSVEQISVLAIQIRLKELGFDPVKVDGIMGPLTREALLEFCQQQVEPPSATGIADTLIQRLFPETAKGKNNGAAGSDSKHAGPTVYYRWTTPEKTDQAQPAAASTPVSAPTSSGSETTLSAQPGCQGTAGQTPQPTVTEAPMPTAITASSTDAGANTQSGKTHGDTSPAAPAPDGPGTDSTKTAESFTAAAAEQPPAGNTETRQVTSPAAIRNDNPASSSANGENASENTPASAESVDAITSTAGSATNLEVENANSQTPANQASWAQADVAGAKQQASSVACQAQESKSDEQAEQELAIPKSLLDRLKPIEGIAYPTQALFEQAVQVLLKYNEAKYKEYTENKKKILEQARKEPKTDFAPIKVEPADCGCSRNFSAKVYGFYPFWLAKPDSDKDQEKGQQAQKIDFSLYNRIGFYALSLDKKGEIANPLQWSNRGDIAQFINLAHQYKVDVDWTVYAADWQHWSDEVVDKASSEVAKFVTKKFSVTQTVSLLQRINAFLRGRSARADGVTLVFDDYSNHTKKADRIIKFVDKLKQKLKEVDPDTDMKINILLGIDAQTLGVDTPCCKDGAVGSNPLFSQLKNILLKDIPSSTTVDYLLVYLPEPTSDTKKALRRQVENEFHGADRREVLRKIIAVVSPDVQAPKDPLEDPYAQFKDDLIYFDDNFKGVGLWPLLPWKSNESAMENIRYNLIDLYSDNVHEDTLRAIVDDISPQICQFACPNRWLVRVALDLLFGVLVIYAILAIWFCRLKQLYKKYFLYFLILPLAVLLLALISLACDPYLAEKRDLVLGLFGLVLLGFIVVGIVGKRLRPPLP